MPRVFASVVVWLRYLVVTLWIAAAAATAVYLPGLGSGEALELGGLIPDDSPAIQAGERSQQLFSVPLTADTAVVERAPRASRRRSRRRSSSEPWTRPAASRPRTRFASPSRS